MFLELFMCNVISFSFYVCFLLSCWHHNWVFTLECAVDVCFCVVPVPGFSVDLRDLFYDAVNIIRIIKSRRMRWTGHVTRMGYKRNAYRNLVGMPEGKRPLRRARHRWEDNIKMYLREIRFIWLRIETNGGLLWTRQWTFGLCLSSWATGGFSRRTQLHGVSLVSQ
jgi:hypothetical protein